MAKILVQTDCENSPKKELLRDFTIAFAKNDEKFIAENLDNELIWETVGEQTIIGKEAALEAIQDMLDGTISELIIENIITHGDVGAVNGVMSFDDGSKYGFCDVYTFTNHAKDAKIKKITSYIAEIKKE